MPIEHDRFDLRAGAKLGQQAIDKLASGDADLNGFFVDENGDGDFKYRYIVMPMRI